MVILEAILPGAPHWAQINAFAMCARIAYIAVSMTVMWVGDLKGVIAES